MGECGGQWVSKAIPRQLMGAHGAGDHPSRALMRQRSLETPVMLLGTSNAGQALGMLARGLGDAGRGEWAMLARSPSRLMLPGSGRRISPAPELLVVDGPQRFPQARLLSARVPQELHELIPPQTGLRHAEPRHG